MRLTGLCFMGLYFNWASVQLILLVTAGLAVLRPVYCQDNEEKQANPTPPFHLVGNKTVKVDSGVIVGRIWHLDDGQAVIFRGIPYAEPPIGKLRFKKPVEKLAWVGEVKAHNYAPACIQFMDYHKLDRYSRESMKHESEDCLYLNIFAPEVGQTEDPYPVLFWIHGGSFLAGSGDTGMDPPAIFRNFVFRGIILVTINYRLGPLGFLSSQEDPDHPGNVGLWDQIAALKWVQLNIAQFGGNPHNVTIMGESAGGASASILAVSPATQGLVHQAIIMSGSAAASWAIEKANPTLWDLRNILDYLACRKEFNKADLMVSFTRDEIDGDRRIPHDCVLVQNAVNCAPDLSLADAWECLQEGANFENIRFRKALTMELGISKAIVDDEIIPANVSNIVTELPRIPIMTGTAHLEWGHKKERYYGFKANFRNTTEWERHDKLSSILEQSFQPQFLTPTPNTTFELVGNATYYQYITSKGDRGKQWNVYEFVHVLRKIESDVEFVAPCAMEATAYAEAGLPVYLYSFERVPPGGLYEDEENEKTFFGMQKVIRTSSRQFNYAFHGLDHAYIFTEGYSSNQHFIYDHNDKIMSHSLTTLIGNFIKFGNPTPTPVQGVTWTPYTTDNPRYMKLNSPLEMSDRDYHWDAVSYWNQQVGFLSNYAAIEDPDRVPDVPLTINERQQLEAYRRAWWALWILVASIAFVLWIIVICMIARRCISSRSQKPYKNIVLTEP